MRRLLSYFFLLLFPLTGFGQYYMRGEVKDERNQPLSNARIYVHSQKAFYHSGSSGTFGIKMQNQNDSLTVTLEGYEPRLLWVKTDEWQKVVLKLSAADASKTKPKLISITKDLKKSPKLNLAVGDETYFKLVENEFVTTSAYPNTAFALNVNKASYSNVRRFINGESPVPPDAVKVEELINYFNLYYRTPSGEDVFKLESQLTSCPWNPAEQLLFLNISAKKLDLDKVPPGNFVFLIDVSGSMDMPNRLPLLKAAFQLFVKNLRSVDQVSIVTYGGSVAVWMQPTSGDQKEKILKSIEELEAAGDTPGESAIRMAYRIAQNTFIKDGNNRIILATDGDFNVGENSEKALEEIITRKRQTGVYLTCLGVGMGNFKDSKLETLAKKGNGNYAYLDDIREAEKVLVKELTQTFFSVAGNVFMNVEFNPAMVKQYRLIGFDNKKEALAEFSNDLEGGEIGSGNSTLAIFEIVPTQQNILSKNSSLGKDDIGKLELKYTLQSDTVTHKIIFDVKNNYELIDSVDRELKFASAVTMFALKLKNSKFLNEAGWDVIYRTAKATADPANYLQNEFVGLVEKAEYIYGDKKRKKKKDKKSGSIF